ncbi:hypothetical protein GPECTOR_397g223 [Gonium pectorale]|uniref:Uncharacterized protein n=1 Tax=Gonium pectorale TaxID=33097 RepID=A0A150FVB8_GONPE|nr:hypothetical protein GPECTOR_397g223 [Gonium pectorale]|eukprot:KXZ41554.1 hypothetical protein GPECTOR_397g223 [Gonium pectorale]
MRHPDPSNSLEELRWRDYQTLRAGGIPPAMALPSATATTGSGATITTAPAAQPQPAAAGPGVMPPYLGVGAATPNTPQFPTPVRTLFPPTPPPVALGAVGGADDMDTSAGLDLESQFHSMYARPENAVASPEEMRVVQVESYKAGRQIAPYWLVGGA